MEARDYNTKMNLQEKSFYIDKFMMKMTGSLPSTAAWWIDGINKGTQSDMSEIFFEIRNEIDWVSPDPQRESGDMPIWYRKTVYDPKMGTRGYTYNREGRKVKVTIPPREEMTPADQGIAAAIRDNKAAQQLKDEENPAYLFSTTWTSILVQIANGEIDANYIARVELANRGLDKKGTWVGFEKAKRIQGIL